MNRQNTVSTGTVKPYSINHTTALSLSEQDKIIQCALTCLESRLKEYPVKLTFPSDVSDFVQLQLARERNEVFAVIFLDNQLRMLAFEKLFHGTVHQVFVYIRVIVERALAHNAAAIILAHNHPSGILEPSDGDKNTTQDIEKLLKLIDVKLLDHIIVSNKGYLSFKQEGLL